MSQDYRMTPWPPSLGPRRPAPSSILWPALALCVAVALVAAGLLLLAGYRSWFSSSPHNPNARPRPVVERTENLPEEKVNIRIYKDNLPSVVHITTAMQQSSFGQTAVVSGTGSGFVWDEDGHIVTNFHVIKDALSGSGSARVIFSDSSSYPAVFVGGAPEKDLAVLWVDAPKGKLHPISLGASHDLQVGQFAYAIGNPYGLDYTFTRGIVSALGREIESVIEGRRITDVIQTDAAINPGNSGGPLLDSSGLLIGVNTAIYSKSGSSAGIGFAIPVDEVNRVVPDLIANGAKEPPKKQKRPGLGIQMATDELARQVGVTSGVVIAKVLPGTAASRAGLVAATLDQHNQVVLGDIIVGIDGKAVANVADLQSLLATYKVGDKVSLEVIRNGRRINKPVTLGEVN